MSRAVVVALVLALGMSTMGASSCGTQTTSEPDQPQGATDFAGGNNTPNGVPRPRQRSQARIGDSITLKGTDTMMKVTVLQVIDPLQAGQYDQPNPGRRFVGVRIKMRNVGNKTYNDSPGNGATLIIAGDEQADSTLVTGGDCSSGFQSDATISPGSQEQGCIAFEVKTGKRLKRFQFGLDSGFGPQTGEWSLR